MRQQSMSHIYVADARSEFITPPACRAWRSFKFALFLFFLSVSEVGAALIGDTPDIVSDIAGSTCLLNSISSSICKKNIHFYMYTTTSKQQVGSTSVDSHPKCFKTTNFNNTYIHVYRLLLILKAILDIVHEGIRRMSFVADSPLLLNCPTKDLRSKSRILFYRFRSLKNLYLRVHFLFHCLHWERQFEIWIKL